MPSRRPGAAAGPRRPDAAAAAGLHDAEPDAARHDVGGLQRRHLDGHLRRGDRRWRAHARARAWQRVLRHRTMPSGWATRIWSGGGSADRHRRQADRGRRAGRHLRRRRRRLRGAVHLVPGTSLEFVATFTGDPYQHSGLGQTLESSFEPFALFSTSWTDATGVFHSGGSLGLRTYNGTDAAGETRTNLGPGLLNAPHRVPHRLAAGAGRLFRRRCAGRRRTPWRLRRRCGRWPPATSTPSAAPSSSTGCGRRRTRARARSCRACSTRSTGVNWQNIKWIADVPAGTTLAISVRYRQHGGAGRHLERVRSGACPARSSCSRATSSTGRRWRPQTRFRRRRSPTS